MVFDIPKTLQEAIAEDTLILPKVEETPQNISAEDSLPLFLNAT